MKKLLPSLSLVLVACVTAFSVSAQEVKGDASKGQTKIAACIGCHGIQGYQASFPEIYKVPMISGQGAKYIVSALTAYKKGERKHPTMRGIAGPLSEQDMADVAAYYEAHGKTRETTPAKSGEPSAKALELVKKGGCVSCHGEGFSKPIDPTYPKIAGQYADYLFVALKAYKTENNANMGRANGVMGAIAKQFSNAEMRELATYVSSLPSDLHTIPQDKFKFSMR